MHKYVQACVHTDIHACMQRSLCMHACIHANMHAQGQFWAWKHGERRWQRLPTHGDHPHSLTEAVGIALPRLPSAGGGGGGGGGAGGKTLGVVFGGYFNSGAYWEEKCVQPTASPPLEVICLESEEDVLVIVRICA